MLVIIDFMTIGSVDASSDHFGAQTCALRMNTGDECSDSD